MRYRRCASQVVWHAECWPPCKFHNSDVKESERTHHVYSALHRVFAQVEELLARFPACETPPADSIAGGSSTEPSENRYGQSGNESVAGVQGSLVTTTTGTWVFGSTFICDFVSDGYFLVIHELKYSIVSDNVPYHNTAGDSSTGLTQKKKSKSLMYLLACLD